MTNSRMGRPRILQNAICEECGEPFRPKSGNANKTCSMACKYEAQSTGEAKQDLVCKGCGEAFQRKKRSPKSLERCAYPEFCGLECKVKHNHPMKPCEGCGELFASRAHQDNYDRYCSRDCAETPEALKNRSVRIWKTRHANGLPVNHR